MLHWTTARRVALLCLSGMMLPGPAAAAEEAPLLARIFSDHMVMQRNRPLEIWGQTQPGEQVTVNMGGESRAARAGTDGRWAVTLPARRAGGPHVITARSASRQQTVSDVLVGDVWLCSGQSNMEWAVRNTINSGAEIQHSANNSIRHVAIPRLTSPAPAADFPVNLEWKVAGPATTGDFSAVCYYYARELQKTQVDVPQGLVNSSWGGTRIETWLSANALRQLGGNDHKLELLGRYVTDRTGASAAWGHEFEQWWNAQRANAGIQPWSTGKASGEWTPAPAKLTQWEDWGEPKLAGYDGMMWYRARVNLSAKQAKQGVKLSLGVIDDVDLVWINGQPIASDCGEQARVYDVPPKLLKAGDNLVVVNVFDMWGSGGIHGTEQRALRFADGTSAPLAGWEYQLPAPGLWMPRAPWEPYAGMNILYNAMIAPLGKFGLRGVAWYQGEANAGLEDARRYQAQLQMLFDDWRRQFDFALPFLVVQLANWNPLVQGTVDSGWAQLRDAQRRAVAADGNAGLAVTIDLGNRDDIHPTNKQDVGRRLARAARKVVFGEKISPSGAQPSGATRAVGGVDVTLGDYEGSLTVIGAKDPSGFELCGASQASCHFVRAQLGEGGVIKLEDAAPEKATRVRFCWADAPICNLYDTTGLPVGPFEIALQ